MNIHPKVTAGTAGFTLGASIARTIFWVMESSFGVNPDSFTPTRLNDVTIIVGAVLGFAAGYMTSSPAQPPAQPAGGLQ